MSEQASKNHCPLCQELNHCASVQGADIEQCWCSKQAFPDKQQLAGLIGDKELANLSGTACICESCLQRLQQLEAKGRTLYKRID